MCLPATEAVNKSGAEEEVRREGTRRGEDGCVKRKLGCLPDWKRAKDFQIMGGYSDINPPSLQFPDLATACHRHQGAMVKCFSLGLTPASRPAQASAKS
jgi:hypothetical protein